MWSVARGEPRRSTADRRDRPHAALLAAAAALAAAVLVLTAGNQIYDSNMYALSEATALLAGDHPYRDFFEPGIPLAAYLSAGAQLVVGYRLIGEFLLQWLFIVAGVVIAFHLGLRLSRSMAASLAMLALALVILANTPTYHYSKLFFFPLTIWAAWRYIDEPGVRRGAALALTTAIAFLFRHDYGVYTGFASVIAFAVARAAVPASRGLRSMVSDAAVYAAVVAVVLMPWAIVVQMNEGLADYVRMRAALYQEPDTPFVYASLLEMNPVRTLTPDPPPAPRPAVVGFVWNPAVGETQRRQLERRHGLRPLDTRDARGRWQYEVSNVYDAGLFELDPYIMDGAGFEWDRMREVRSRIPARANVARWLEQMALVTPLLLLAAGALELWRGASRAGAAALHPASRDGWRMVFAGIFLAVVDSALFREPAYMVVVAPVTAALSARFVAARTAIGRGCAIGVLLLTGFAAVVWAKDTPLARPSQLGNSMSATFEQLLASPPVRGNPSFQYLHECTAPGDRLLVTGVTPFHVSYYAERPIAGGHLAWRRGWRSDPVHEEQSLSLLRRQSVPIAVSTHDPVPNDFRSYPKILAYLRTHYVEVEGSHGLIFVDSRRQPTRRFGPHGFPCFR